MAYPRYRAVFVPLAAALLWSGSGRAQQAVPQKNPESIWHSSCAYCHEGGVAHPILGAHLSTVVITQIVRSGVGAMPPFHPSEISPAQLQELALWVNRQPAPKGVPGRVP
jgi:mono/diheme cytochrome c family protein